MALDSKIPKGPLADKWTKHKSNIKSSFLRGFFLKRSSFFSEINGVLMGLFEG